MEEKKSNKKIIVIAIIVVIVLAIAVGVYFVADDYRQKTIVASEMDSINSTGEINTEIKSKGKYAEVEKALKDYLSEYKQAAVDIAEQYKNEQFATILSAENFKNDGPNFESSKKLINDVKAKGEETKTKLAEMVTEEYKEKRATDSGLTGKYKDLFKDSIKLENDSDTVDKTINSVNNYLDKVEEVFNFLKECEGKWQVNGDKVEFRDMSNLTKYNSLITSVNIAAKSLSTIK